MQNDCNESIFIKYISAGPGLERNSMMAQTVFLLFTQILQSLANNMLFTKEKHMEPLNEFVKENLTKTQQ